MLPWVTVMTRAFLITTSLEPWAKAELIHNSMSTGSMRRALEFICYLLLSRNADSITVSCSDSRAGHRAREGHRVNRYHGKTIAQDSDVRQTISLGVILLLSACAAAKPCSVQPQSAEALAQVEQQWAK